MKDISNVEVHLKTHSGNVNTLYINFALKLHLWCENFKIYVHNVVMDAIT